MKSAFVMTPPLDHDHNSARQEISALTFGLRHSSSASCTTPANAAAHPHGRGLLAPAALGGETIPLPEFTLRGRIPSTKMTASPRGCATVSGPIPPIALE